MTSQKLSSLLELASEDLGGGSAATTAPRHAAYLLSQAAEKARAVCEHEGIQVGTTHNIGQIGALLPSGHPMREAIEGQNYHSSASTKFRYPDPAGRVPQAPSPEELKRRIADVTEFLAKVQKFVTLGDDDDDADEPPSGLKK